MQYQQAFSVSGNNFNACGSGGSIGSNFPQQHQQQFSGYSNFANTSSTVPPDLGLNDLYNMDILEDSYANGISENLQVQTARQSRLIMAAHQGQGSQMRPAGSSLTSEGLQIQDRGGIPRQALLAVHNGHVMPQLAGNMGNAGGAAIAGGVNEATQQRAAPTAATNGSAVANPQAAGPIPDIPETISPGAADIMAKIEPGLINGHLMVKKANGELVDFDEVRPKIKVMPKAISSYANAVADAVWGLKSLATKHLSFYVVQSGDNISQRLPRSQVDVLKKVLNHERQWYFDDILRDSGVPPHETVKRNNIVDTEMNKLLSIVDQGIREVRRDRVSLKKLSSDQKLNLVLGDQAVVKELFLRGEATIREVAAKEPAVRDMILQLAGSI